MSFCWKVHVVDVAQPGEPLHQDQGNGLFGEDCYWEAVCAVEDWFSAWAEEVLDGHRPGSILIKIAIAHDVDASVNVETAITLDRLQSRNPYPDFPPARTGDPFRPSGSTT
jgi:hypothetical protein